MALPIEALQVEALPVLPGRRGHLVIKTGGVPAIPECGSATIPGLLSERSCVFYGARWMLAAIPDVIHLVHGPAGCAYYGGTVRRKNYRVYSSMMEERDIVFGGGSRLYAAILEAVRREPAAKAVLIYATCAAGLIGEDLDAICGNASAATGLQVVPVNSPGFRGCSQAAGHDLAASVLLRHFIGAGGGQSTIPNSVNILGEFDVQGDLQQIEALLQQLGLRIICAFSGRASTTAMAGAHRARLNIVHCRRTGQFLADGMQERFGTPHLKASFFGLEETAASLRAIGRFFGTDEAVVETAVETGCSEARRLAEPFLKRLRGKRVALFFGASRMGSMSKAFRDLGMNLVMIGSQFGCRVDYEDAGHKVAEGTMILDDAPEQELEIFLHQRRPDLLCGGTKEKYMAHKMGVPFMVFPQEGSPFAGFRGFVNLAREAAGLVSAPVWRLARSEDAGRQTRGHSGRGMETPRVSQGNAPPAGESSPLNLPDGISSKNGEGKMEAEAKTEHRPTRVAVASNDGLTVDRHFGNAEQFLVFDLTGDGVRLSEIRTPAAGDGCAETADEDGPTGAHKGGIEDRMRLLSDCEAAICIRAGHCAQERLGEYGLQLIEACGGLPDALRSFYASSGKEKESDER